MNPDPSIAVLIPTFGRPDRLRRVVENVQAATAVPHETVFVIEEHDTATKSALDELPDVVPSGWTALVNSRKANYSGAVTTGYLGTFAPFVFAGADDLAFHDGWAEHALARMDDWVKVVGTNDLLNPFVAAGLHATHYLVARDYLDDIGGVVDQGPGSFLNDAYTHQWTDTEFIGTAKARARFRPCLESIVEHMHAYSSKPGRSEPDATTAKGMVNVEADGELYDSRKHLWWDLSR